MVDLSAELGIGDVHLRALVDLGSEVASVKKVMQRALDLQALYQFAGKNVKLQGTATSDSSGDTMTIGLGGPAVGRKWEVQRIVVGGVQWTSTVAGSALYVIGGDTHNTAPALPDIVDETASLPKMAFYSTGQIVVRNPQHLYLVIVAPTASTQYAAGGQALDLPDGIDPRALTI